MLRCVAHKTDDTFALIGEPLGLELYLDKVNSNGSMWRARNVVAKGAADRASGGKKRIGICNGDYIIAINGIFTTSLNRNEIATILMELPLRISVLLRRCGTVSLTLLSSQPKCQKPLDWARGHNGFGSSYATAGTSQWPSCGCGRESVVNPDDASTESLAVPVPHKSSVSDRCDSDKDYLSKALGYKDVNKI